MDSYLSLLYASVGGNVELLTLCLAGALLSYLRHWSGTISAALSNGVYKIFFPALAFGAVLDTVHRNIGSKDVADVWVPLLASVVLSLLACLIAFPVTWVIASGKDELVKRAIFMCLVLGNSNTMALLIMQSLCDTYQPLGEVPKCVTRSTTYSTLFILPVTVLTWTFVFPYLLRTPNETERDSLLRPVQHRSAPKKFSLLQGVRDSILCPPTVTVIVATLVSFLPHIPEMLLKEGGVLHPILISTNLVGTLAVPLSSIIVGAELYEALNEEETTGTSSKRFGNVAIVVISVVRFIIYPFVGRLLHRLLGLNNYLNPLLRVFILTEWTVTSANNTIIMASIIAEMMPGRGERLRRDVAKCVFLQYLISPILVTINTALALKTTYE